MRPSPIEREKAEDAISRARKEERKQIEAIQATLNSLLTKMDATEKQLATFNNNNNEKNRKALEKSLVEVSKAESLRIVKEKELELAEKERWKGVQTNIRWVFENDGAKQNYDEARSRGMSKYQAVIHA